MKTETLYFARAKTSHHMDCLVFSRAITGTERYHLFIDERVDQTFTDDSASSDEFIDTNYELHELPTGYIIEALLELGKEML